MIEITFGRALKVWWSFVWRSFVLFIPLWIITVPLMLVLVPHPGTKPDPAQFAHSMGKFFIIWLVLMIGNVVIQVFAMRWMLKTRWSDFRLTATND